MTDAAMPGNLKLVLEHLHAVRELNRYLRKKGMDKDIQRYASEVFRPAMEGRVPTLGTWQHQIDDNQIAWYPKAWELGGRSRISLAVILSSPIDADDEEPSVNLFVPSDWPGHGALAARSRNFVGNFLTGGFESISEHPDDWDEEYVLGKYVEWQTPDGSFKEAEFVERIAREVQKVVELEPQITQTIREFPPKSGRKKAKR